MRVKILFTCLLIILLKCAGYGQQIAPVYPLLVPENWHTETFALPPQFATVRVLKISAFHLNGLKRELMVIGRMLFCG
ncbi:hypothetical protein SNE26_29125 [Mucilaginibacter sp. cycad4]|uniref:hypothetical protein n=1 Tax=Mucilaginibacter sp. cycad4 TaxID=3342096 RepID=UPI002AAAEAB8|nr:hypothetical protein [Mucilaginibacter gossypii]WPV00078.1 hypothetical protein SNE26_29125 [Mucilaginibacter gossypii]